MPHCRREREAAPGHSLFLFISLLLYCVLVAANALVWGQADPSSAQFEQASEAMRAGDLDTAATGFEAVVRQSPSFAEAHFNLGLVREEQGQYDEAIASFQKALVLKPRLHGANLFLGITEFRLNRLEKAHTAVAKETASYPKDASAWMWLGVVCLAQDKPEDAAEALDTAAKLKPDDGDILSGFEEQLCAHVPGRSRLLARASGAGPGQCRGGSACGSDRGV